MMSEIPFPMPRSEICSPTHMMKAVPVVRVRTVSMRKPHPGEVTTRPPPAPPRLSSQKAMPRDWMTDRTTVP